VKIIVFQLYSNALLVCLELIKLLLFVCSAMTLTHVSGVSGLSEALEPTAEEPTSQLLEQIEALKKDLEESQAEVERYLIVDCHFHSLLSRYKILG